MVKRHLSVATFVLVFSAFFLGAAAELYPDVLRYVTGGLSPGPPASTEELLYLVSEDRYLYAFAYNGERLWRRDLRRRPLGPAILGPDGTIYVSRDGRGVSAYNRRGIRLWDADISDVTLPPTVTPRGLLVVPRVEGTISVYSPSGRLLNSFRGPGTLVAEPVLLSNGYLLLLGEDGVVSAVDGAGNRLWQLSLRRVPVSVAAGEGGSVVLGLDDGRILILGPEGRVAAEWQATAGVRQVRSGGTTIAATLADGRLWVLDREDDRVWVAGPPGEFLTGVTLTEDWIASVSQGGKLYLFSPEGALIREYRLPEKAELSEPTVLAGGGVAAVGSNWVVYLFSAPEGGCRAPWGCYRGGQSLAGRSASEDARDLVLPRGTGGGSLERIYFERLLSSADPEERGKGLDEVRRRLEEGRLGSLRVYVVPLLRGIALRRRAPGLSPEDQRQAVRLLGQIGTYEASGALSDLAAGAGPDLLETVAEAIGGLGSDPNQTAARALLRILQRSSDLQVVEAVVRASQRLVGYAGGRYSPAFEGIVGYVSEGDYPMELKRRALALGSLESFRP